MVKSKNHDFSCYSKNMKARSDFLTPKARLAFTKPRQIFVKALILHYFDLEYNIWMKSDTFKNIICDILSQLTSNNFDQ